jgi:hypothetical protein
MNLSRGCTSRFLSNTKRSGVLDGLGRELAWFLSVDGRRTGRLSGVAKLGSSEYSIPSIGSGPPLSMVSISLSLSVSGSSPSSSSMSMSSLQPSRLKELSKRQMVDTGVGLKGIGEIGYTNGRIDGDWSERCTSSHEHGTGFEAC